MSKVQIFKEINYSALVCQISYPGTTTRVYRKGRRRRRRRSREELAMVDHHNFY
jgi:hypothetical protein